MRKTHKQKHNVTAFISSTEDSSQCKLQIHAKDNVYFYIIKQDNVRM